MPRDSALIQLGPGTIRSAPLGTAEPPDLATAYVAAWVDLGYTEAGHTFAYQFSSEDVNVAEEIEPVRIEPTGASGRVSFAFAQITIENLKRAFNGGTVTVVAASPGPPAIAAHVSYEPPAPSAQVRRMLAWDSDDGQERWIWRQVIQVGNVEVPRVKAPAKALIPVEFRLEKPSAAKSFKAMFATARQGT